MTSGRSDAVMIRGTVLRKSDKAWLVSITLPADMRGEEVWLPFKEVAAYSDETIFSVPRWLAEEKGIG